MQGKLRVHPRSTVSGVGSKRNIISSIFKSLADEYCLEWIKSPPSLQSIKLLSLITRVEEVMFVVFFPSRCRWTQKIYTFLFYLFVYQQQCVRCEVEGYKKLSQTLTRYFSHRFTMNTLHFSNFSAIYKRFRLVLP